MLISTLLSWGHQFGDGILKKSFIDERLFGYDFGLLPKSKLSSENN